jgi:hypothetical protein
VSPDRSVELALELVKFMEHCALAVVTRAVGDPRASTAARFRYVWHSHQRDEVGKRVVCGSDEGMIVFFKAFVVLPLLTGFRSPPQWMIVTALELAVLILLIELRSCCIVILPGIVLVVSMLVTKLDLMVLLLHAELAFGALAVRD